MWRYYCQLLYVLLYYVTLACASWPVSQVPEDGGTAEPRGHGQVWVRCGKRGQEVTAAAAILPGDQPTGVLNHEEVSVLPITACGDQQKTELARHVSHSFTIITRLGQHLECGWTVWQQRPCHHSLPPMVTHSLTHSAPQVWLSCRVQPKVCKSNVFTLWTCLPTLLHY